MGITYLLSSGWVDVLPGGGVNVRPRGCRLTGVHSCRGGKDRGRCGGLNLRYVLGLSTCVVQVFRCYRRYTLSCNTAKTRVVIVILIQGLSHTLIGQKYSTPAKILIFKYFNSGCIIAEIKSGAIRKTFHQYKL